MVQGFERRDVIEDANSQSRALDPQTVPLSPVMRPNPSSFSRVGEAERELADALGKADIGLQKYVQKKSEQWRVEGMMARAEGQTEQEIAKTGNRFTQSGWQVMNGKLAGDELYQTELNNIATQGKTMDSKQYQKYLSERLKGMMDSIPAQDADTRNMIYSYALDMYPKLVSEQVKQNNEYNKAQTIDSGRKMLVSTAETDGPEAAQELLDPSMYNLAPEDYSKMVANALQDSYDLGSNKLETALSANKLKSGTPAKTTFTANNMTGIMNLVGHAESKNNYSAIYGGENPELTRMSLNDVLAMQTRMKKEGRDSTAVGKYQIINATLSGLKDELGLTGEEVFDENLQDNLGIALLKRRGVDDYLSGKLSADAFQFNLSQEWAAIPKDSSGLSFYEGDGLNHATVEPGFVLASLTGDQTGTTLYDSLSELGMASDDISRVIKSRDAFQSEQSAKFDAARLLTERDIEKMAVDLSDEDLIKQIDTAKKSGGYSDAWANSLWNSSQAARKAALEERKKENKVRTLIATNSVQTGSKEEQQKAIDLITQAALESNPEAIDPTSPNQTTARRSAMDQVYKFMYTNQIKDDRLTSAWEVASVGDIVDKNGKVKPAALDAYSSYLQARNSTNDPLFAQGLLSDKTKDLFLMADSYRYSSDESDAEQALVAASAFVQKQEMAKNTMSLPWWKDWSLSKEVSLKLRERTLPGMFNGFYGMSRNQAQMRWSLSKSSVERAAKSTDVTDRIKHEAAKLWNSTKHWDDQNAARDLSLAKATERVLSKSEYVAGSFVFTGDQPSIAERIGMGGIRNAGNMVVSRIMSELGPTIWKDYNETDFYTHSQTWYEKEPGIGKFVEGAVDVAKDTVNGTVIGNTFDKIGQKSRGVPDFAVTMNTNGNALVLAPYTNFDRTQQGVPFILSVEKMREAATFLNRGDEAGFKKWAEEQKASLPKY
jgi:muramidase (phage lysozyme)